MVDITNCYWIIADSQTEVYSSASNTMVAPDDPDYAAWLSSGNVAINIPSVAELAGVLQARNSRLPAWLFETSSFIQPTPTTYTMEQLATYSASVRYARRCVGVIIASLSPVAFMSDPVSTNDINSAYDYTLATNANFRWKMSDGSFVSLNKGQTTTVQNNVQAFVQNCYTCESTTLASINSGSITDLPTIDAAYAAVSNTF